MATKGTGKAAGKGANKGGKQQKVNGYPSKDVLGDLCMRFVANVPPEELQSFERMMFHIEQAHWFYEDNVREEQAGLKSLSLREFTEQMFTHCALLKNYTNIVDKIYENFTSYKHTVPVHGAVILNSKCDKVLLVQGWSKSASWGFPKGKINKDEETSTCAIREVYEETGFDISSRLVEDYCIEKSRGNQLTSVFVVAGVPESTVFEAQTKKEIGQIAWHNIKDLPRNNENKVDGKKYFMVSPFMKPLQKWIKLHRSEYANSRDKVDAEPPVSAANQQRCSVPAWSNFTFDRQRIVPYL